MNVILQQDVKGHGKKGQMVKVSDGYARNFLFPKKLAVPAAEDTAKKLESCVVKIEARAGAAGKLFGAVTSKEIAEALSAQCGITLEKNKIVQDEPIKTFGGYEVKCKLGYEVSGVIHVLVTEQK